MNRRGFLKLASATAAAVTCGASIVPRGTLATADVLTADHFIRARTLLVASSDPIERIAQLWAEFWQAKMSESLLAVVKNCS